MITNFNRNIIAFTLERTKKTLVETIYDTLGVVTGKTVAINKKGNMYIKEAYLQAHFDSSGIFKAEILENELVSSPVLTRSMRFKATFPTYYNEATSVTYDCVYTFADSSQKNVLGKRVNVLTVDLRCKSYFRANGKTVDYNLSNVKLYFAKGIGIIGNKTSNNDAEIEERLVGLMSIKEFERTVLHKNNQ